MIPRLTPAIDKDVRLDRVVVESVKSSGSWRSHPAESRSGRLRSCLHIEVVAQMSPPPLPSGRPFYMRNRLSILELDSDREIVAIDVERDLYILRVQIWTGRIVEAPYFATGQDQPTNGVGFAQVFGNEVV